MNITPLKGKLLVESRGVKENGDAVVIVPEQYIDNSDVCTTQDGQQIIKRHGSGVAISDTGYIIEDDDILAVMLDGEWAMNAAYVMVRKCIDPESESGIVMLSDRTNRFAEILAAGPDSGVQTDIGHFAHVDDKTRRPQKVEETQDDWIVHANAIEFVMGD